MTLCDDCLGAERDPHGIAPTWKARLCCKARAVAMTPRAFQRQAFDAVTAGLEPLEAQAVRERAYAILASRKVAA